MQSLPVLLKIDPLAQSVPSQTQTQDGPEEYGVTVIALVGTFAQCQPPAWCYCLIPLPSWSAYVAGLLS